jgi:hypothetical protein
MDSKFDQNQEGTDLCAVNVVQYFKPLSRRPVDIVASSFSVC